MTITRSTHPLVHVVLDHRCLLGEGPVWDARRGLICWIDILNGEIHQYDSAKQSHQTIQVHQPVGSIALCRSGQFVAAVQHGFCFVDRSTGTVSLLTDPEAQRPGNRFNEGKCDPAGRFWAGTMAFSEEPHAGSVYVLHPDRSVTCPITPVSISNGLAWSLDGQTLYYIDTPTRRVMAYPFDVQTGQIGAGKPVLVIPEEEGFPDGMTIDSEGMLWIGHWGGWQVVRWNPHTGEIIQRIPLPVAKVTSCTFGGPNLTDLYITTARVDLSEAELRAQPLAGSLFVWPDCGIAGVPAFYFDA